MGDAFGIYVEEYNVGRANEHLAIYEEAFALDSLSTQLIAAAFRTEEARVILGQQAEFVGTYVEILNGLVGAEDRFGAVREGLEADLVLLDANPLTDISESRRIHGVMLRGRWLDRGELDALLTRFER